MAGTNTGAVTKVWMGLALLAGAFNTFGQQIGIDTAAIRDVVHEWNFANNTRSLDAFQNVYADDLLFYTQKLTKAEAIGLKSDLFQRKPGFRQTLASEITFTLYTSGVTRCDFVKEVWERSAWKKYRSYLLISYEDTRYQIVGESDYPTDQTLGYDLDLGEEIEFYHLTENQRTGARSVAASDTPIQQRLDTLTKELSRNFESLIAALPGGMMIVPKSQVYVLMAMLVIGGLMIFIADSIHSRKKRRRKPRKVKRRDEGDAMVTELNNQSVFESFVVTLFDPIFFRHKRPKGEKVYVGGMAESQPGPDLEFTYQNKDFVSRFAVKCIYVPNGFEKRWELLPTDQFGALQSERQRNFYIVLGIGGTPDDPKELYLLPAHRLNGQGVTRNDLRPYAKSGMFYFHRKTGELR